ncbi:50S ribosomal protein L25/general stress protein Ctc [Teichococcus aestuarii]|uniref:Large ribosomal subunit protein bL25 n=1 Tax=Teichococcus aestuarii TaxID=568898 RepID=A0A2U1V5J1_9PROT|nr:50S ribosomal protein L25/general stress protein Ctc [Pseudoroseomonas aestuarii]PWC29187.1 50S ribosomal protein L25/general stress protein Ctc [Pseudoroseomonas aestuarii]
MVQTIRIEAEARELAGKGAARATRRTGRVPAVIYGAKQEATLLSLDPRDVMKELHKGGWQSHLYEVAVNGTTERCLMRDVQFHPVKDIPLHVDFQRLAPGQLIRVKVPVVFLNEESAPGIKEGGVLNVVRREVEVLSDPDQVPDQFEIDMGAAAIGDSLRWSDVADAKGTQPVIVGRDFVVATIAPPTVEEEVVVAAPVAAAPAPAKGKGGKAAPKK